MLLNSRQEDPITLYHIRSEDGSHLLRTEAVLYTYLCRKQFS